VATPGNGTTRRTVLRSIGAGVVATSAVAGGVSAQESETATGTSSGGSTHEVRMVSTSDGDYYFDPIGLHVQPGDTIRWTIEAGSHNVVSYDDRIPEGAETFETEIISEGSHEMSFDVEGTYDYYCAPHQTLGMVGRFVVGEAGGPAEGSMPGDGDVPESSAIVEQGSIAYDEFTGGSSTSTPAQTETDTAAPTDTEPAEDEATEASGPGFTAVGALSALGAGALLRAYRNRDQ
jgi:plastocyanin